VIDRQTKDMTREDANTNEVLVDKLKALIVDDDNSIRQLYDKALSEENFLKNFSENGNNAIEAYQSWKPDIIILDVYMPVMTGYSVLKKIREEFEDNKTAIIMSTNINDREHIKDCIALGIQGYIIKPFNFKEVSTKIMQYYENYQRVQNIKNE
jgi:DNA-binding response OmpR family regulator